MTPSDAASDPQIAALQAAAAQAQAELEAAQAQAALAAAKVKAAEAAAALAGAGITASGGATASASPVEPAGPGSASDAPAAEAPADVPTDDAVGADTSTAGTGTADTSSSDELSADTIGPGPLGLDDVLKIRDGYLVHGPALEMGALVNGEPLPGVQVRIPLSVMNRHGLVAGATGTGKTRTLQGLVEQLSAAGVPVFAADIKGDLSGIATPGESNEKLLDRTRGIGQDWTPAATPTVAPDSPPSSCSSPLPSSLAR